MSDRAVLVTGVAGDLGGALAADLHDDGWVVYGLDQRAPAFSPPDRFFSAVCDLTDPQATEEAIEAFHQEHGAFDAVVNCACMIANAPLVAFEGGRLVHHDFDLWQRVIASCLSSAFYVTACTAARMARAGKGGVIVNISSVCARGNAGQTAYSAAKAGLEGFTFALAKELGPLGIRGVAIAPGYIDTGSTRSHMPEEKLSEIVDAVPVRRLGTVAEVAAAVRFALANDYVNGTVLELDGGLVV